MYEIVSIRAEWSDDLSHEHVTLAGYSSPHMPGEPVMVPVERIRTKTAFGEQYFVRFDGEQLEVRVGTCAVCGYGPILTAAAGQGETTRLLELPRR